MLRTKLFYRKYLEILPNYFIEAFFFFFLNNTLIFSTNLTTQIQQQSIYSIYLCLRRLNKSPLSNLLTYTFG